jgi:hypothetical protein
MFSVLLSLCVVLQGAPPHLWLPHPHGQPHRPQGDQAAQEEGQEEYLPSKHTLQRRQEAVTVDLQC